MDLNVCGDERLTLAIPFRRVGTVYHLAKIEMVWVTLLYHYDETVTWTCGIPGSVEGLDQKY